MTQTIIFLTILILLILGILLTPFFTQHRRKKIQNRPFPPLWTAIIDNHLPIYPHLLPDERRQLQGKIKVFLAEKQFIGCGGLKVTEEMKITIAAVACLLIVNQPNQYFPKLRSILVYPSSYLVNQTRPMGNYIVEEKRVARLGESWTKDQLVLSWEQVKQDTQNWHDGHNVILHEFAHQLDQEDGQAEGVPILATQSDYQKWAKIMSHEYKQLCENVQQGKKIVMSAYGATNPAEFFAVATETFFEKPQQLFRKHPQLYQQLQDYYHLNPLQWIEAVI